MCLGSKMYDRRPRRPIVNVDAFEETPSQYLNLTSKTLEQKIFNTIFDNQGIGYSRMSPDMQMAYHHHIKGVIDLNLPPLPEGEYTLPVRSICL